jgi:Fe-S oxidoreductase
VECPSHVNIPALVLKHKQLLAERGRLGLRERMLLHVRPMGRMGSRLAPLANALMGWHPLRGLLERVGGIRRDAPLPDFTADRLAEGRRVRVPVTRCSVAYFAGCFELFNESDIARAALEILAALGCDVVIPTQRCCGIPKISAGNVKGALKDMRFNLGVLAPLVEAGYTVTSGCPSCVLTLTDDYPELAQGDDRARLVAEHTKDLHSLILDLFEESDGRDKELFNPWDGRRVAYHAPCHLRAAGRGDVPRRLLERMLGMKFVVTSATCCGMGGTYGLKSANAETSALIAQEAFDRIKAAGADAVVTSCGMCRTQLAAGTGLPVYHPMQLLAESLKESSKFKVQSSK